MIEFRDATAQRLGLDLIVHVNQEGLARGINPIASGSALHTEVMKTEALKQALDRHGFDAAIGGARRDEEKSRAKERIFSLRGAGHAWDPRRQRPELWRLYNTRLGRARRCVSPAVQLDRTGRLGIHRNRGDRHRAAVFCQRAAGGRARRVWIVLDDDRLPLAPGNGRTWRRVRFRTLGCYPLTGAIEIGGRDGRRNRRRAAAVAPFRAAGPADRRRRDSLDGAQKAPGLFLMPDGRSNGGIGVQAAADRSLLRFLTCGSVDDGKSTLIGRLLYNSDLIMGDQLAALKEESRRFGTTGGDVDFSPLLDGLEDERQQRITIDVAYGFSPPRGARSLLPIAPGTNNTRATATVPRPPIWRCSSSTRKASWPRPGVIR
jgi:3'-phosphoadenosine 5'-phosphosulfate sulfotransferase (PAPS reductase)/FAD synthetase